jgi:hypothetical protein
LFLVGVLVFCDAGAVASTGFVVAVALLFALGSVERRLRALAWAAILVASAFFADFLWQSAGNPSTAQTITRRSPRPRSC